MTTINFNINDDTADVLRDLFNKVFTRKKINIKINFLLRANQRVDNSEELTPIISNIEVSIT
jgi:hypothetical protein